MTHEAIPSMVGTWDLQSINGEALPAPHRLPSGRSLIVVSERAIFADNGFLTRNQVVRNEGNPNFDHADVVEQWEQHGNGVQCSGDATLAIVYGDRFARTDDLGYTFVYQRLV